MTDYVRMTPWRVTLIAVDGTEVPGPKISLMERAGEPNVLYVDKPVVFKNVPSDVYDRLRFEADGHGLRLVATVGPRAIFGDGGKVTFDWHGGPAIVTGDCPGSLDS